MNHGNTELEGGVKINDLNMNQEVPGIVADYEKRVAEAEGQDDCADIPKEQMDVNQEAERMVARGRLNRHTGMEISVSPKARTVQHKQSCPTPEYLIGYDGIRWDMPWVQQSHDNAAAELLLLDCITLVGLETTQKILDSTDWWRLYPETRRLTNG